jgi:hypothetical protein
MQRSEINSRLAMWYPDHPASGTVKAAVGHACAQGMSSHTMHGWSFASIIGVPAARPPEVGTFTIAWTGHTGKQSPHRVQAAMNAISSRAPGGRIYRF